MDNEITRTWEEVNYKGETAYVNVERGIRDLMKLVLPKSTCQKRSVVCVLLNAQNRIISYGVNSCNPEGGTCHRLGLVQDKSNYDHSSNCRWVHAEIDALKHLLHGEEYTPYKAVLYGHEFFCLDCENELKKQGVVEFQILTTLDPTLEELPLEKNLKDGKVEVWKLSK